MPIPYIYYRKYSKSCLKFLAESQLYLSENLFSMATTAITHYSEMSAARTLPCDSSEVDSRLQSSSFARQ